MRKLGKWIGRILWAISPFLVGFGTLSVWKYHSVSGLVAQLAGIVITAYYANLYMAGGGCKRCDEVFKLCKQWEGLCADQNETNKNLMEDIFRERQQNRRLSQICEHCLPRDKYEEILAENPLDNFSGNA
jgi:hypothetical protein